MTDEILENKLEAPVEGVKLEVPAAVDPKVCTFCGKVCLKGSARKQHEKFCEKNPDRDLNINSIKPGRPKKIREAVPAGEKPAGSERIEMSYEPEVKSPDDVKDVRQRQSEDEKELAAMIAEFLSAAKMGLFPDSTINKDMMLIAGKSGVKVLKKHFPQFTGQPEIIFTGAIVAEFGRPIVGEIQARRKGEKKKPMQQKQEPREIPQKSEPERKQLPEISQPPAREAENVNNNIPLVNTSK
jgi:hypothetical protein